MHLPCVEQFKKKTVIVWWERRKESIWIVYTQHCYVNICWTGQDILKCG